MSVNKEVKRITTNTLQKMKAAGEKNYYAHCIRFFICQDH